jgi:hypothetical protein
LDNKKGAQEPLDRAPPRLAGGLSTPGDAPRYEYDEIGDNGAHESGLPSSALFINIAAAPVKPNAAGIWRERLQTFV